MKKNLDKFAVLLIIIAIFIFTNDIPNYDIKEFVSEHVLTNAYLTEVDEYYVILEKEEVSIALYPMIEQEGIRMYFSYLFEEGATDFSATRYGDHIPLYYTINSEGDISWKREETLQYMLEILPGDESIERMLIDFYADEYEMTYIGNSSSAKKYAFGIIDGIYNDLEYSGGEIVYENISFNYDGISFSNTIWLLEIDLETEFNYSKLNYKVGD